MLHDLHPSIGREQREIRSSKPNLRSHSVTLDRAYNVEVACSSQAPPILSQPAPEAASRTPNAESLTAQGDRERARRVGPGQGAACEARRLMGSGHFAGFLRCGLASAGKLPEGRAAQRCRPVAVQGGEGPCDGKALAPILAASALSFAAPPTGPDPDNGPGDTWSPCSRLPTTTRPRQRCWPGLRREHPHDDDASLLARRDAWGHRQDPRRDHHVRYRRAAPGRPGHLAQQRFARTYECYYVRPA
jgi:hypothetical protein